MTTHPIATVTASPPIACTPQALHQALRESVAIACGLEKMAQCALDEGEYPAEELDNLFALINRHRRDLEEIKAALAELATGARHE